MTGKACSIWIRGREEMELQELLRVASFPARKGAKDTVRGTQAKQNKNKTLLRVMGKYRLSPTHKRKSCIRTDHLLMKV